MIFSEHSVELIRMHRKTQTTRLKEPCVKIGGIYPIKRNLFKKENFGKIRIVSKKKTTLRGFTLADIKREGYTQKKVFREALERINKKRISLNEPLWKVIFEYIPTRRA